MAYLRPTALAPLFSRLFANGELGAVCAKTFAIGVGFCWNFLANYPWTFRSAPDL
jgi:putative flippase GtrA